MGIFKRISALRPLIKALHKAGHVCLSLKKSLKINHYGATVFLDPKDFCGRKIYLGYLLRGHWHHEELEKTVFAKLLNRFTKTFLVDVGASYGMYSIMASSQLFRSQIKHIYAVEGSLNTFRWLVRTIQFNNLTTIITPFNLAITNTNGQELAFFQHPQFSEWSRPAQLPSDQKYSGSTVFTKSLDSLLPLESITDSDFLFIKIDIEGGEPNALEGLNIALTPFSL